MQVAGIQTGLGLLGGDQSLQPGSQFRFIGRESRQPIGALFRSKLHCFVEQAMETTQLFGG
jgi:hypothetical protein